MTTYRIPDQNLSTLQDALAKVAKAARKLHLSEPTLTETGEEFEEYMVYDDPRTPGVPLLTPEKHVRRWVIIEVTGEAPVIAGWRFAAMIQFVQDEAGNRLPLFRAMPDVEIPVALRTISEPWCDHCRLSRNRKDTYLVVSEAGEWRQVGSSCLVDFTGHPNPQGLANYAQELFHFCALAFVASDPDAFGLGDGGARFWSVKTWLTDVARSIREDGWMSKGKARDLGGASTYERVDFNVNRARRGDVKNATAVDEATALATLAWVRGLDVTNTGLSDYEYNLAVACLPDYVDIRVLGIVTSAVAAYQRAQAQEAERATAASISTWQGEIGKKLTVNATILARFDTEGSYGVTHIIKFRDEVGNRYVWFCSSLPTFTRLIGQDAGSGNLLASSERPMVVTWDPQAGQNGVLITGTVKSHNEYRGVQETVLTRCKVKESV